MAAPPSRPEPSGPAPIEPSGLPLGRAAFLGTVAAGVGGIAVAPFLSRALSGATSGLPTALQSLIPSQGWRIYAIQSPLPRFDPATYRLEVGGLVERPMSLHWKQVAALPGQSQVSTFHCVTGWTIDNVHWEGVRPATIIDLVRPLPEAKWVTFLSLEQPYYDQLSLDQFRLPDVMLARHMDGRPISRSHGSPLRLVIPDMYGYKGVKWVRAIRFDRSNEIGYWEARGYDVDAWVGRSNGYG